MYNYLKTVNYGDVLISNIPPTNYDRCIEFLSGTNEHEYQIYQDPDGYLIAYELPAKLR